MQQRSHQSVQVPHDIDRKPDRSPWSDDRSTTEVLSKCQVSHRVTEISIWKIICEVDDTISKLRQQVSVTICLSIGLLVVLKLNLLEKYDEVTMYKQAMAELRKAQMFSFKLVIFYLVYNRIRSKELSLWQILSNY